MSQPFAAGDLLVAATDVDDRNVDLRNHAGPGRVLHYGADFALKGELRTGQTGLVVGLAIDPADARRRVAVLLLIEIGSLVGNYY